MQKITMNNPVASHVCVILLILVLNLDHIKPNPFACMKFYGEETCYSTTAEDKKYRLYGTKTAYHVAFKNNSDDLMIEGCTPKVFYLLCRHATRYPDKKNIQEMNKILPLIQEKISNASRAGKAKLCKEDLKLLNDWVVQLKPEYDNNISPNGILETVELARRFKSHFPSLLSQRYSPQKFVFGFTSRVRTKTTAEAFAQGLFNEDAKRINFDDADAIHDDILQFHKECKVMQENCSNPNFDTSEIDKFEEGPILKSLADSLSERVGFRLTFDEIKIIYRACSFGYALQIGDIWCSIFTPNELKVLDFGDDIDDYYKDSYGNKINYEQACPAVQYIMNLFESYINSSETKVVLQFSHAGGVKKVFSRFGLYEDDERLGADQICSQNNRKWRSSYVAPFLANLALVLYDCGNEKKIVGLHNEKLIKLGGCKDKFCSFDEFYEKYQSISENCDVKSLCCTCCKVS